MRVLVTGASGLLGRAFMRIAADMAHKQQCQVLGLAFSRYDQYKDQFNLKKVDLCDKEQLRQLVLDFKPTVIIHSAAERNLNNCENNKEKTFNLNVSTTEYISDLAKEVGAYILLISSDYVFDGTSPPYTPDAKTHPLSFYGETKRESEVVALKSNPLNKILRVPVLYGQVENLKECSVTMVANQIINKKKEELVEIDNSQIRYPTLVDNVARVGYDLIGLGDVTNQLQGGIYHYTGNEKMTKYDMAKAMASIIPSIVDTNTIKPLDNPPITEPRPHDAQLDLTSTTEALQHPLPQSSFKLEISSVFKLLNIQTSL
ncbi:methionine adenosyltransferase regulatory beta subunit [Cavenderia fasciculata]|uniref:Methionine adenosyltransferase regulatory beta subunit n=1 Tax=Cavenderia fasciculata TaxID=261658 RepID=F4PNP7_CACFS|nr:methionine adenosyltransferase regulatory beta subunit [Cavenderia fasciculata]EGG23100.1 methionine adenosyltransferase regulatory beta subunit [Cavenderia fasciculata]|eukprot:XP_004360951.1 methionine adenosyltransferase regulatory beta subunit [Cavenderia fasciculata]